MGHGFSGRGGRAGLLVGEPGGAAYVSQSGVQGDWDVAVHAGEGDEAGADAVGSAGDGGGK